MARHPSLLDRSAEQVARAGYDGLMRGRRLIVPGWQNWLVTRLPRLLPRALVLGLVARSQDYRFEAAARAADSPPRT
jgi:short-subunit dehydrogenase